MHLDCPFLARIFPVVNGVWYATSPPQFEHPVLKLASHNSFLVERQGVVVQFSSGLDVSIFGEIGHWKIYWKPSAPSGESVGRGRGGGFINPGLTLQDLGNLANLRMLEALGTFGTLRTFATLGTFESFGALDNPVPIRVPASGFQNPEPPQATPARPNPPHNQYWQRPHSIL